MYIRVTGTPNSPRRAVKVVESIRDGYTVRQVIVKHIGIVSDESQLEKVSLTKFFDALTPVFYHIN